ncbi:CHAD domain-containing protein [candidate division KSB1 bacterium]|nr:CHAD domain-containing protein [candidate division KSB1 bacterium]
MDVFLIPDHYSPNDVITLLEKQHAMTKEQSFESHFSLLDTMDWRLYQAGYRLEVYENHSALLLIDAMHPLITLPFCKLIASAKDLEPLLSDRIGPLLGNRSLFSRANLHFYSSGYKILDSQNQASVALTLDTLNMLDILAPPIHVVRFVPLQESKVEIEKVKKTLLDSGLKISAHSIYEQIFRTLDIQPGTYKSKVMPKLTKRMTVEKAAAVIFKELNEVSQANIKGVIQDIDNEFLHDFRTSIRRTRSALSLFKNHLNVSCTHFRKEFRHLGKRSNKLRDLDVFLENQKYIHSLLPEDLSKGLFPFFEDLQAHRSIEHKKVAKTLSGKRFSHLQTEWSGFIKHLLQNPSNTLIKEVADQIIYKKYSKVLEMGTALSENSSNDEFHRLRIQCKKLRYALEFFYHLYPVKNISRQIKILKSLQDHLGLLNDKHVHSAYLLQIINSHPAPSILTAASLGGVITRLHADSITLRREFEKVWSVFKKTALLKQVQQLYGSNSE